MAKSRKIKVLFAWHTAGPYHAARMKALADQPELEVTVARLREQTEERHWVLDPESLDLELIKLSDLRPAKLRTYDAVVVAGYYERPFIRLIRSLPEQIRRIVFSESCEHDRPRRFWREWAKRGRLRHFDAALAAGKLARDYLVRLGFAPNRIEIVGNVADDGPFRRAREKQEYDEEHRGAIVYAGRLAPEKNLRALVEGYADAREAADRLPPLVLAGSGPLEHELHEAAADRGIAAQVFFLGETKPEPLARLLAGASFLVLPSLCEPWGLVVNEAMHAGRPVLASPACGCLPELLRPGAAWLLRGFGQADIREGLLRAWNDRRRWDQMGERAAGIVEDLTPEQYGQRVAAAIGRTLWGAASS